MSLMTAYLLAQAPAQQAGSIQGIVTRPGTQDPIPNVQITLSGGQFDPEALRTFLMFLSERGVPAFALPAGGADERFLQTVTDTAASRGVSMLNPEVAAALRAFRAANDARFSALSDSSGRFAIRNIPPGTYTVRAQRDGYFGIAANGTDPAFATATATVADRETAAVSLAMFEGATISGRVRNAAGEPQPNTTVEAYSINYQNGLPVLRSVISKQTDDRGDYRLFWLPEGDFYIAATPRPPAAAAPAATDAKQLRDQQVPTYYPSSTDVRSAVPAAIRGGERFEGFDIAIRTVVPAKITGVIHTTIPFPTPATGATALPVLGATLQIVLRDTDIPDNTGANPTSSGVRAVGTARVAPEGGTFEVTGILPGSYDLYARIAEPNPDGGAGLTFGHAPVDVRGEDVNNVSIEVHPSVRVRGTVKLDGKVPVQTGIKLSLQADGSAAKFPVYQAITARAVTASTQDGSFAIPAVTAGHFRIAVQGLPPGIYISDVLQTVSVFDSGFDVGREPPNPLEVRLNSGAGSIDGTVLDAAGKPNPGAMVVLAPPDSRRQNRALYQSATADAAGHFKLGNIAPGTYKLFAWQTVPAGAYFNTTFMTPYENRGRTITVVQDSSTNVEIPVIPAYQ